MCKTENLPDHGSGDTALGGQKLKVLTITSFKRLKSWNELLPAMVQSTGCTRQECKFWMKKLI